VSKPTIAIYYYYYYSTLKLILIFIGVRARGLEGLQPPRTRAKPLFLGQKVKFSGRSQQPKMKKKYFFVFIKRKTEFIPSSEINCPKSGIFTKVGRVGQNNFAS